MLPAKIKGLNQDTSDESNDEEEENPITKEALVSYYSCKYVGDLNSVSRSSDPSNRFLVTNERNEI